MKCPKCATELPSDATFCPICGTPVTNSTAPAPQPAAQQLTSVQSPAMQPVSAPQTPIPQPVYMAPSVTPNNDKVISLQKAILRWNRLLAFLLLIAAVGVGYLAYVQFRQSHSSDTMDSTNRVLVIEIDEDLKSDEISDETQVKNALKNGGMIRLKSSDLSKTLKLNLDKYAAANEDGTYWVFGALLNYIASEGWELVQAPSSGLSQSYYFRKK